MAHFDPQVLRKLIDKDPVRLDDSVVEIEGREVELDWLTFWSDTFCHTDMLHYQSGDTKMMFTTNPETVTYEIRLKAETVPDMLETYWDSGERFGIYMENSYFDLDVNTAWVADMDDNVVTIVAKVLRKGLAHVS